MIYLDNAATSMPLNMVINNASKYMIDSWHNPSSISDESKKVKQQVEKSRKAFADFIGAKSKEIFFTSCGSESNNWAIKGFINGNDDCLSLIVSEVEHPSVYEVARYYEIKNELHVYYCPVDKNGLYRLEDLKMILQTIKEKNPDDIPLVSMMYVNNETGVVNDINVIADIVHKYGGVFHSDMVQSLIHIPINMQKLNVDMASFSFCKIGMPRGLGALYIKDGIWIDSLIHGGKQESGLRAGTENTFCMFILKDVIDYYNYYNRTYMSECNRLCNQMLSGIKSYVPVEVTRNGINTIPNILSLRFKGIDGSHLRDLLGLKDISLSTGSACKSGENTPSRVLKAMGLSDEEAKETIRISFDHRLSDREIEDFVYTLVGCIKSIQMLEG